MVHLCFVISAAFPSTGPLLTYFNFGTFDVESVKFFTGVTDAACKLRKEENAGASKVKLIWNCNLKLVNFVEYTPLHSRVRTIKGVQPPIAHTFFILNLGLIL